MTASTLSTAVPVVQDLPYPGLHSHARQVDVAPISEPIVCGLITTFDLVSVLGIGVWAAFTAGIDLANTRYLVGSVALLGSVLSTVVWHFGGAYKFETLISIRHSMVLLVRGLVVALAVQLLLVFLSQKTLSESLEWLSIWFVSSLFMLTTARAFIRSEIVHWERAGRLDERIAIVGATTVAQKLMADIAKRSGGGRVIGQVQIAGLFDDRYQSPHADRKLGMATDGTVDDLVNLIRNSRVDTVIIALCLSAEQRIAEILEKLRHTPVDVRLCPDHVGLRLRKFSVSDMGQITMLNVMDRPLRHWRKVIKDIEDRVLGLIILLLIAPVMLLIAVLIKLDSRGPVLFRQKRVGYNNQMIEVLKFRTMYDAMRDPNAEQQTQKNDPRVTRIGAFLRRTSLDELPQFINVVRGDMSIVGPRPHALATKAGSVLFHNAVESYDARHRVKPGITGWAQVNGWRGETQTVEQITRRVEHDLFYVEHWSIAMDIKIIIRTIFSGFTGRSAY
ncbi:MAG: undecaprenyl-phosphate glucose phosphotransferase [Rhodospirillaceae bacterium]|nr:MAG: undecaprenyl-phosphate glucose phosphotransferase [Rhodospirillaceae bacterium]